ncbi:hypothetical protein RFI_06704 [Reticulomyxa filosa]|uniref:Rho-GAP domain-containing protein n=1 Tax=Reticulomyxa filosa TaxID=46433 RepID=X6NWS6_RETFI|nr:hypothetical protein RFI_06704 [Reticulomyxa filosa]|eukprot:ETO30416.1 hypothetical protein RFI_06704 [Reticulomyxa filosa]
MFKKTNIESFGKEILSLEQVKLPAYEGSIPRVLIELKKRLNQCDGFQKGSYASQFYLFIIIFFINVHKKKHIFHSTMKNDGSQAAIIGLLLKQWFMQLPNPFLSCVEIKIIDMATSVELMPTVSAKFPEPHKSVLLWLWDLLADVLLIASFFLFVLHHSIFSVVVELRQFNEMTTQHLAQGFGPLMTHLTERDVKGPRATKNAMFASRVITFFKRGIEWRLSLREL